MSPQHRRISKCKTTLAQMRSVLRDASRLDDRTTLLDLGLLVGAERFRRELVWRRDHLAEIGESLAHGRIAQSVNDGGVELADDVLRRSLGRPDPIPGREIESGQSGLVHGWNIGSL